MNEKMNEKIEIGKYYLDKNGCYGDDKINDDGVLVYCFGEESFEESAYIVSPFDDLDYPLDKFKNFLGMGVLCQITLEMKGGGIRCLTAYKDSDITIVGRSGPNPHKWIPVDPSEDIKDRFQKTSCFMRNQKKYTDHMVETYKPLYKDEVVAAKDIYKKEK